MNTKRILKFKEEFDHFLHGGKVLSKYIGRYPDSNGWIERSNVWTTNDELLVVINDDYIDLRIAEAEGKQIQYLLHNGLGNEWVDCTTKDLVFKQRSVKSYRIKPDKHEFQVGDWCRNTVTGACYQITDGHIFDDDFKNLEPWEPQEGEWVSLNSEVCFKFKEMKKVNNKGSLYVYSQDDREIWVGGYTYSKYPIEPWMPEEGELCIFWSDTDLGECKDESRATIAKFKTYEYGRPFCPYTTFDGGFFQKCIPYKGNLPEIFEN